MILLIRCLGSFGAKGFARKISKKRSFRETFSAILSSVLPKGFENHAIVAVLLANEQATIKKGLQPLLPEDI